MFYLSPRAIVAASVLVLLGSCPANVEAQTSGASSAPAAVRSNPWDKYSPSASQPEVQATPAPLPSAVPASAAPSSAAPASAIPASAGANANPWDKYDTSDKKKSEPKATAPAASGSNPWDKYATDRVPMVPFAPNTPAQSEAVTGANPWDKYVPASMPKAAAGSKDAKEKVQYTELAPTLPERKVPEGPNKVLCALTSGKSYYYAIEYNGQLIGYSDFQIGNEIVLDGRASLVMTSSSRVKVGSNAISDLQYYSKLHVSKRDLTPTSLQCSQKAAQNDYSITCVYSPSVVAQNNSFLKRVNSCAHQLRKPTANLLFNNLWGQLDTFAEHYWLLVLSAVKGGQLDVYDPILRTDGRVTVFAPVQEKWSYNGKAYSTMVYTISDLYGSPLAQVRLDAANKELLEIKEIGTGISFRRSNAGVIKAVAKAPGVNLWPSKVRISNIYFSDPNKLTHLEADVEMALRGGQLAQHSITGYEQKTYGKLEEGKLTGRIVVDVKPTAIKQNLAFPLEEDVPEEVRPYLEFDAYAENDNPYIYNKANEITWKAGTVYQAARRLTAFIANNIENGMSLPSAVQTLEHGVGNPESKALLLVDMARSVGIPARSIGGLVYQRGEFAPHYWAELWMGPEAQWMAFDPSTNEAGSVNASHVALWHSGDVHDLQIEVTKFAPHPPRQVPFFNKKMQWPVGEKRTYAIVSDGKRIGTETAHLQDLQLIDNRESYSFRAVTDIFDRAQDMPGLRAGEAEPKAAAEAESKPEGEAEAKAAGDAEAKSGEAAETKTADAAEAKSEGTAEAKSAASSDKPAEAPADKAAASGTAEGKSAEKAGAYSADPLPEAVQTLTAVNKAAAENAPQASTAGDSDKADGSDEAEAVPAEAVPVEPPKVIATSTCDNLYNSCGLPQNSTITIGSGEESQQFRLRFTNNRVYEESEVKGQTISREIPVSNGLYLADQRFLSQWVLAIEQIPTDEEQEGQEAGSYSIHIFVPELLSSQELLLTEDEEQFEVTRPDGTKVQTTCLRSEKGMEFYLDENHHVVKLAVPNRKIELYLEKAEFSLE